jgi:hypothetical protein
MSKVWFCSAVLMLSSILLVYAAAHSLVSEYLPGGTRPTDVGVASVPAAKPGVRTVQRNRAAAKPRELPQPVQSTEWFPYSRWDVWILRLGCLVGAADGVWLIFIIWMIQQQRSAEAETAEQENREHRRLADRCVRERDRSVTLLAERDKLIAKVTRERDGWIAVAQRERKRADELESCVYVDEQNLKDVLKESGHYRH